MSWSKDKRHHETHCVTNGSFPLCDNRTTVLQIPQGFRTQTNNRGGKKRKQWNQKHCIRLDASQMKSSLLIWVELALWGWLDKTGPNYCKCKVDLVPIRSSWRSKVHSDNFGSDGSNSWLLEYTWGKRSIFSLTLSWNCLTNWHSAAVRSRIMISTTRQVINTHQQHKALNFHSFMSTACGTHSSFTALHRNRVYRRTLRDRRK